MTKLSNFLMLMLTIVRAHAARTHIFRVFINPTHSNHFQNREAIRAILKRNNLSIQFFFSCNLSLDEFALWSWSQTHVTDHKIQKSNLILLCKLVTLPSNLTFPGFFNREKHVVWIGYLLTNAWNNYFNYPPHTVLSSSLKITRCCCAHVLWKSQYRIEHQRNMK